MYFHNGVKSESQIWGVSMSGEKPAQSMSMDERRVVWASSMGTVFEWYDFYLYGALAAILSKQFFSSLDPSAAFLAALLAFGAGFVVRPFGAIFFGRLGDMIGRKYTFLLTILIMGLSTFMVGILPSYASIGAAAPVMLIYLRLLQGFAMGGEYGGAATYVAEHAPHGKRGAYTSWIQTTATLGLLLSLVVVMGTRHLVGEAEFAEWGWRVPFILSILLLAVSVYIRLNLNESPVFLKMKADGKVSRSPVMESFGQWKNLRLVLVALFGLTAGQAVIWYAGHFYTLFFLTQALQVDEGTANWLLAIALLIATPFFVMFGALSDRVGRKPVIMLGFVLAAASYFHVFAELTQAANPALHAAQMRNQVRVVADPADCSFQINPIGEVKLISSCDIATHTLANHSVSYTREAAAAGTVAQIYVGQVVVESYNAQALSADKERDASTAFKAAVALALEQAGYPGKADPDQVNRPKVVALLTFLLVLVAMVYGPIAAMLVEMFPTRLRYTAMSLPYHIGNGWFGGLLPTLAFAIVAYRGDMYSGLWYPVCVIGVTLVVCLLFVKETKDVDIYADH
jgi:MFS family permease